MSEGTAIKDRIRSRGHWRVAIHPATPPDDHLPDLRALGKIVSDASVSLRGWDFPHIDHNTPIRRGLDWQGQESEWAHHRESWRLHRNGLFIAMTCIPDDWRDVSPIWPADEDWQPGAVLGIGDALFSLTEFFVFAGRLATSEVGSEEMVISVTLHGAKGRALRIDSRGRSGFHRQRESGVDVIPLKRRAGREQLLADGWEMAAEEAQRLFEVFGWDTDLDLLVDHQRELRGYGQH